MAVFLKRLLIRDPTYQAEILIFVFLFISRFALIRIDISIIKSLNISGSASKECYLHLSIFSVLNLCRSLTQGKRRHL